MHFVSLSWGTVKIRRSLMWLRNKRRFQGRGNLFAQADTCETSFVRAGKKPKNKRKHKVGQKRQRQICARLTNRETTADADPQRKVVPFLETAWRLRSQHMISARSDAAMFPENRIGIKIEGRSLERAAEFSSDSSELLFPSLGLLADRMGIPLCETYTLFKAQSSYCMVI